MSICSDAASLTLPVTSDSRWTVTGDVGAPASRRAIAAASSRVPDLDSRFTIASRQAPSTRKTAP